MLWFSPKVVLVVKIWLLSGSRHMSSDVNMNLLWEPVPKSPPPPIQRHYSSTVLGPYRLSKMLRLQSKSPATWHKFPPSQQQIGINLLITKMVVHLYLSLDQNYATTLQSNKQLRITTNPSSATVLATWIQFQRLQDSNRIVEDLHTY